MKSVYIAEKPSVAREFANALGLKGANKDGYIEAGDSIVTWCVGHLVTMSYPDAYDASLKKWTLDTLPFIPEEFRYQVIDAVKKQFNIVKGLLNREDVERIYVCTDSGREGEYIYRLVDKMAEVGPKDKRRVWIDSQTEEEIIRGIKEAKSISEYDNLSSAAYLRAQEDYLMGINFSRVLTLKYGYTIKQYLGMDRCVVAVGRVMTCVLGLIVRREREVREFVKTPFYRVIAKAGLDGEFFEGEWRAVEGSRYFNSPLLYKENGFKAEDSARQLIEELSVNSPIVAKVEKVERKQEKKNPPLLYNLAELQNDCSRIFKISPAETLKIVQELYEKKLVTYPRTDARVLSTAVSKEIYKNISGLKNYNHVSEYAARIIEQGGYKNVAKSRYVNDSQITDHYAIIPTGQGLNALGSVPNESAKIYELIARRFLSIFYPPAVYQKTAITYSIGEEKFFANFKVLIKDGYLKVAANSFGKKKEEDEEGKYSEAMIERLSKLKKGDELEVSDISIKEGETSPPKRYTSGTLILAMENAGQLIEDEELRSHIKGSGIGTSATRDSIIEKLVKIKYIALNKKTQVVTPTHLGEIIYEVVAVSIRGLLNPELTASWEKGLSQVAEGTTTEREYTEKLDNYITKYTNYVKGINNQYALKSVFDQSKGYYKK